MAPMDILRQQSVNLVFPNEIQHEITEAEICTLSLCSYGGNPNTALSTVLSATGGIRKVDRKRNRARVGDLTAYILIGWGGNCSASVF